MFQTLLRGTCAAAACLLATGSARAQAEQQQSPSGWIGVYLLRSESATVIASVFPGTPAQKARLAAGDTIVSLNGTDATGDQSRSQLSRLLTPGRRITMRLRHNGVRTVTMIAVKRPPESDFFWSLFQNPDQDRPATGHRSTNPSDCPVVTSDSNKGLTIRVEQPLLDLFSTHTGTVNGVLRFAGANIAPVTADLANVLHVRAKGMFVVTVSPGTPARKAGLRGGDIILKVDSVRAATPAVFAELLSEKKADDSTVQHVLFNIVREGKLRRIALSW